MVIRLDMSSDTPIYIQLRNQIVMGIGRGELEVGERLPTVRQLAADTGINTMTVNKAYQLLKSEGFIEIDRRHGAMVRSAQDHAGSYREKLESELELLSAEARLRGMEKPEFLDMCEKIFLQFLPQEFSRERSEEFSGEVSGDGSGTLLEEFEANRGFCTGFRGEEG